MTNLSEFFSDFDLPTLRAKVLADEGIDIQGVYCLATGKQIGTFESEEIQFAITEIGTDDEESLIDDLLVRVVASMRPSPSMNRPDRFTVREMIDARPVDALAFLVNRLQGSRQLLTKRDDGALSPLIARISTHKQWSELAAAGVDLKPWIHWLLEIDCKMNLHDMTPPAVLVGQFRKNLFDQVTLVNHLDLLKKLESWTFEQIGIYDKRDAQATRTAQWVRGNSMTGPAFVRSWLENPEIANRKLADDQRRRDKLKNPVGRPPRSEKAIKLQQQASEFLGLLEGLLDGTIEMTPVTAPIPKKGRVIMGANLLFAKRGV